MNYPKLKHPRRDPPGGFVFKDPDTNVWMASKVSLEDLYRKCIEHRRANGLEIPAEFVEKIEAFICYRLDADLVIGMPGDRKISLGYVTLMSTNHSTGEFLLSWTKAGAKKVPQAEAEKRAEVCFKCEYNMTHICLSCKGILQWVGEWIGHRKTTLDKRMGICGCDKIVLYAALHADDPFEKHVYPKSCWKGQAVNGTTLSPA